MMKIPCSTKKPVSPSCKSVVLQMNGLESGEDVEDPLIYEQERRKEVPSTEDVDKGTYKKLVVCFAFLVGCIFANMIAVTLIHDHIPDAAPLPDVWFWLFKERHYWTYINEACGAAGVLAGMIMILASPIRLIILSRGFYLTGLLYAGRLGTVWVTLLPRATPNMICAPRLANPNFSVYLHRTLLKLATLGTESYEVSTTCGDTIFSGHTIVFLMPSLIVGQYAMGHWRLLHRPLQVVAWIGMAGLLMTRSHYTVDVVLSYFFTTRIFWSYHNFVDAKSPGFAGRGDVVSNIFWYPIVRFIEDW